jgi:hypothetical protein
VVVYDIQGKEVMQKVFTNTHNMKMEMDVLDAAHYLVKIVSNQMHETRKVMLTK